MGVWHGTTGSPRANRAGRWTFACLLLSVFGSLTSGQVRAQTNDVLITEFMASNISTLADEDGDFSDWIEVQNITSAPINLGGWYLTDDDENLTKWAFPSVELNAGESLIVFASDKNRAEPESELHTSFKLEVTGEYLALVRPNGESIAHAYAPLFPPQYSDVSYGLPQESSNFLKDGDDVRFRVPDAGDEPNVSTWMQPGFDDLDWSAGVMGMGFVPVTLDQFSVTVYRSNIPVLDLTTAEGVIADPATHLSTTTQLASFVNFLSTGSAGRYGSDAAFPAMTIGVDENDFVVEVTGAILIPSAGLWTFGVNSDDGFGLTLSRFPHVYSSTFPGLRGAADTLAVFDLAEPGLYEVRLVSFERTGGASLEFFAAPGSFVSFNSASFDLVGNVAEGGLPLAGIADELGTNVESQMKDINASLWIRREFSVPDPSLIEALFLEARYEDGFVAYLNGTEIVTRNAPEILFWNATAAADRPLENSQTPENTDLSGSVGLLVSGNNVLAIHALNDDATNDTFFMIPKIVGVGETDPSASPRYFAETTPGSLNNTGFPDVAGLVSFSHDDTTFTKPFSVVLSANPGAVIKYTLDNTNPTESSGIEYTGPIDVTGSVQVRARAFEPGNAPSPVRRRLFSRVNGDILSFESNLPIVVVDTFGHVTTQNWYTLGLTSIRDIQGTRARMSDAPVFVGATGLKIRGSSSTSFPKKQYAMETWDQDNDDMDVALLGFPGESDWILYGPYTDKSLMRDFLAYRWSNAIGRYAVRTRYVEVYFDQNGGGVSAGDYAGVYILQEKIKQGPQRVNVAALSSGDISPPAITGGYILKKDRLDPGDVGFLTNSGQRLAYVYPKETEITTAQANYIRNYLNDFESALNSPGFADPVTGYAAYIDPGSFIDHHIMVEITKNIDGFRLSTFMFKDRGGKLHMGPVWDYNLTLGNANYLEGWLPTGWYHTLLGVVDYPWWTRLFQDPEFALQYADRWHALRRSRFKTDAMLADIDEIAELLEESQQRNYIKWPILGVYVWPNWFIGLTYAEEIDWMKQWLSDRLTWMDEQLRPPPAFNHQGGVVAQFFELLITAQAGAILYTTDGSDPRLLGGGINPLALTYTGPVMINHDMLVVARSLDGQTWSARNEALFDVVPIAVVNEVLPLNSLVNVDEWGDHDPWIELYNPLSSTADLSGYFLTDNPAVPNKWPIPAGTFLCGDSRLVIWADNEPQEGSFHTNFVINPAAGSIRLSSPNGELVDELSWPVLVANQSFGRLPDAALNAQRFSVPTPGALNQDISPRVFLNEYNAVTPANFLSGSGTDTFYGRIVGNGGDWFEVVVATDHADLRGWQFLISEDTGGGSHTLLTLTLTQHAIWSDLRAGTIVTVSEDLPSDISYDPATGDWWINVQAANSAGGALITAQGFETSQRNWQLTIKNALGVPVFGPAGEGINPASGIGSDEVCKLEENPSLLITPASNFRDGSSSSFGAPNIWSSGTLVQDFSTLRNVVFRPCASTEDCDDADVCTTDLCMDNICTYAFNNDPCDDADDCTDAESCSGGLCMGSPVEGCCKTDCDCDDADPCTMDTCFETACSYVAVSGADCDDQDPCTENDACQVGICVGTVRDCSWVADGCNTGLCNAQTGQCETMPANEGASCDDLDSCTDEDTCSGGVCAGTNTCCTLSAIGPRYLSVTAPAGHASVALLLDSIGIDCLPKYVTPAGTLSETPVFQDSASWDTVAVADQQIVPGREYHVRADIRTPNDDVNLSQPVYATTWNWGDSNHDDRVDLLDIICVLDGFADVYANCALPSVDLQGQRPDRNVDLFDIIAVLDAFQDIPYPIGDLCSTVFVNAASQNSGTVTMKIASRQANHWGEQLTIDVYLHGDAALRAYQLRMRASADFNAHVRLDDAWVTETRPDYAFSGRQGFAAVNKSHWKIVNARLEPAENQTTNQYLATFRMNVACRKATRVIIELDPTDTIILDQVGVAIPTTVSPLLEVLVSPTKPIDRAERLNFQIR